MTTTIMGDSMTRSSTTAQAQYGDLPSVKPRDSRNPFHIEGRKCVDQLIPIDELADWREANNMRAVKRIGHYWPPVIFFERVS